MSLKVTWVDSGREPQCAPDPAYPDGKDVEVTCVGPTCYSALPYPSPRCGYLVVKCEKCGMSMAITTAGRPDDPRSIRMPCKDTLQ